MKIFKRVGALCMLLTGVAVWNAAVGATQDIKNTRLYVFDCGHVSFKDMGMFSDTGEYDGKPDTLADPCFLIRHPKGTLLWDTGLGDKLAETKGGSDHDGVHAWLDVPLLDQLKSLGLAPADITYVAFSHFHFDHTGNANEFTASTWIINKVELNWALSTPTPFGVDPTTFSAYKTVKTQMIDNDYDVFGDGSVRILKAPGHTPGHQALMLKLHKAGTVILAGDLYHLAANRTFKRVPGFNFSRADTLASIDRIEKLAKNTHARLIVQHDPGVFKTLPKSPAYID